MSEREFMSVSKQSLLRLFLLSLVVTACMIVPSAALADGAGSGVAADPALSEGVVNTGFGTVNAGDVVVCDFGAPCSMTDPTTWSDVLVFYNPAIGPFIADFSGDATDAAIFSDDDTGFYSLANFLANYNGLSLNAVSTVEDASGNVIYGSYTFNSPETTPAPEPGTLLLLGSGLLGIGGLLRRKLAIS